MKIRLGKSFLGELDNGSMGTQDERTEVIKAVLIRGRKTKTGISVEVNKDELEALIDECEWHSFMWSPEPQQSSDERRMYHNLLNQLKSLKKIQEATIKL